jgi:predicted ATPase
VSTKPGQLQLPVSFWVIWRSAEIYCLPAGSCQPVRISKKGLRFMIPSLTAHCSSRRCSPSRNVARALGIALFCLGFPDQALAQSNAAIAEADSLAHPPSLAASFGFGTRLLSLVRESSVLRERVNRLFAVTIEQSFAVWRALGTIYSGWVKIKIGDLAEGISLLRNGSIAYRATGTESLVP